MKLPGLPVHWNPLELVQHASTCTTRIGSQWQPKRILGFQRLGLACRLKSAWMVFTGRWDVLVWPGQENDNTAG